MAHAPRSCPQPCPECPFNRLVRKRDLVQLLEGYPNHDPSCEVLCHQDGFASECVGFRKNARRLGLLPK